MNPERRRLRGVELEELIESACREGEKVRLSPAEELVRRREQLQGISDTVFEIAEEHHPGIEACMSRILRRIEELEAKQNEGQA